MLLFNPEKTEIFAITQTWVQSYKYIKISIQVEEKEVLQKEEEKRRPQEANVGGII